MACALAVRVALIAATQDYDPVSPFDAVDYDRHAASIANGDGYPPAVFTGAEDSPTAFRPPLYPYLLGATYKLAPGTLTAGRLVGALLGTIAVLLIFLIAERLWNRRVGIVAAAIAAVFPPLVVLSSALTVESLFIPIELGLVLAVLAYQRSHEGLRWVLVGGGLCGLAALTRQNGFIMAIPLLLGIWAMRGQVGVRRVAVASGAALLATFAVVTPWLARNSIVFDGKLVPISTSVGYAMRGTYNDLAREDPESKAQWRPPHRDPVNLSLYRDRNNDEADIDKELLGEALDYIAEHPVYALEATALNAYRLINPEALPDYTELSYEAMNVPDGLRSLVTASYFAVALLALGGAALAAVRKEIGPLWLWSLPIILALSFASLSGEIRYRTMIDPFLVMLAAIALAAVAERVVPHLREPAEGERLEHSHAVE